MRNPFGILSQMGIRKRFYFLLLVVLVPFLLLEVFTFYRWYQDREKAEIQANLELARAVGKNFEAFLEGLVRSELGIGLGLTASPSITDEDRNRMLDTFAANNPLARSVMWMNADGLVVAASYRPHIGYGLSDRSFFARVKEGRDWAVSELILGRETKQPSITIGRGIRDKQGQLLGVVAFATEIDRLDSVLGIIRWGDAGVSLIDNKGMHAYRYPPRAYTWEQRNWLKLYPVPLGEALKGKEVAIIQESKISGANRLVAFVPIASIGWVASCSRVEQEVTADIIRSLLPLGMLVLVVTLLGFGTAVAFIRPVSNSITALRDYALAIGRGKMESVAPITGPEELKDLAVAFDRMAEEIRSREAALLESEEKARNLITHAPTPIYEVNLSGTRFLSVNDTVCELSGYSREELLAMSPMDLVDEPSRDSFRDRVTRKLAGEEVNEGIEYEIAAKDGRVLTVEIRGVSFSYRGGKPESVLVVAHDISERKRAEEALRKAHDELEVRVQERTRELASLNEDLTAENEERLKVEIELRESEGQVRLFASQCLTAQETERKRIAAELHDSLAASLAATKFRIETISQGMQQGSGNPESMKDLASNIGEIITEVRRIMSDLRPSVLDDLGIIAAVNWFSREYQKSYSHISVEKQLGIEEHDVPESIKTPIFRISQEAMNNVAKHSRASHVNLSLQKEEERIVLTIQDNGQGFDPESVKKGMGLSGIRERAELSGGTSDLQSGMGKGTTIRVSWPL